MRSIHKGKWHHVWTANVEKFWFYILSEGISIDKEIAMSCQSYRLSVKRPKWLNLLWSQTVIQNWLQSKVWKFLTLMTKYMSLSQRRTSGVMVSKRAFPNLSKIWVRVLLPTPMLILYKVFEFLPPFIRDTVALSQALMPKPNCLLEVVSRRAKFSFIDTPGVLSV